MFARRGGESVAVGPDGRVYVTNGQIFVYTPDGKEAGRIDVPARPLQLLFGGTDRGTLFILTHHALYSAQPRRAATLLESQRPQGVDAGRLP